MSINTFSKFNITTNIRKLLVNDSELNSFIDGKIYPIVAPEDVTGDIIIYYRDKYGKDYTKFGVANENCNVFIVLMSDDYDRSIEIINLVNDLIEGVHTTENGLIYECRLIDSTEDYEDKKYLQILLFEIK